METELIKQKIEKAREINILLLGHSGAGKSTTLNAFANYLKYSNFDEAQNSLENFSEVVPAKFTLYDKINREAWIIKSSVDDVNEQFGDRNTFTQAPVGYTFKFKEYTIRIIDTPGDGDTGGGDEDVKIFDKILEYLQHHEKLNAILIVVNGDNFQHCSFFKYCITEMLTHLHKSVWDNIILCFTHSRKTDYGPGEGFVKLKSILERDLKIANFKLTPNQNCFFIDNEWFRFMMAKRQNFPFTNSQVNGYRESWEESAQQVENLFENMIALPPHELNKTISLKVVRKIIFDLAQPMVQIERAIKENIEFIKQIQNELELSIQNKNNLNRSLYVNTEEVVAVELDKPITVCTNESCPKFIEINDQEIEYLNIVCHDNCTCWFVTENIPGQQFIKFCKVMKVSKLCLGSAICRVCGCSWRYHKHLSTVYKKVQKKTLNTEVFSVFKTTTEAIRQYNNVIREAEQLIQEYQLEERKINEIRCQLACILSENSIWPYNQYFDEYIDLLIQSENDNSEPNVALLTKIKSDNQKNVQILAEAIENNQIVVKMKDVEDLRTQLLQLKHSGKNFLQILKTNHKAAQKQLVLSDKQVLVVDNERNLSLMFKTIWKLMKFNYKLSMRHFLTEPNEDLFLNNLSNYIQVDIIEKNKSIHENSENLNEQLNNNNTCKIKIIGSCNIINVGSNFKAGDIKIVQNSIQ